MIECRPRKRAFTIVEILVTVTIIALLLGLLLPGLSAVKRQSRKRTEANNLKQVHYAWMLYANHSKDATVPGYLDVEVQLPPVQGVSRGWGARYEFPDQSQIPPFADCPCSPPNGKNATGPWTWRLMKYLDYSPVFVEHYEESPLASGLSEIDQESVMLHVIKGPNNPDCERYDRALAMAEAPIFGYNGFYVGGYWRMQDAGGVLTPKYDYFNHCESNNPTNPNIHPRVAIPLTISQIRRSSELITFCAATRLESVGMNEPFIENRAGTHLVTPPFMAEQQQWGLPQMLGAETAEAGDIRVHNLGIPNHDGTGYHAGVPFARYGGGVAVLRADGHIDQQSYNALYDMRLWVDSASHKFYQHNDNCPTFE